MPTEVAYTEPLLRGIKNRLDEKHFVEVCPGGYAVGGSPSLRPQVPYMVLMPDREGPAGYTAKRKVVDVDFTFILVTRSFEQSGVVQQKLFEAIQNAPLVFTGDYENVTLSMLRPGDTGYSKDPDKDEWVTQAQYKATLHQLISHSGS